MVMIYGPRNTTELDTVASIVQTSYAYANATLTPNKQIT
jgi:hypothetical protein